MKKISVIVPVYNVERYLHRCVESILVQTYQNLEVILVNDGSTDHSGQICDEFAKLDARVVVIHKKNGGLSSARNAGLQIAAGDYVGFVDSDDDIDHAMYEKMIFVAQKYDVDFVMADYLRVMSDKRTHTVTKAIRGGFYSKQDIKKEIFPELIMGENLEYGSILSVWNCLYKKQFLNEHKITFADDIKWSEDNLFSSIVGYHARSFYYLKEQYLYHYYQNLGTITTSYRNGAWQIYKKMNVYLQNYFMTQTDYNFSRQIQLHLAYYAFNVLGMENTYAENLKDKIKKFNAIVNDELLIEMLKTFSIPNVNFKLKIQIALLKLRCTLLLVMLYARR